MPPPPVLKEAWPRPHTELSPCTPFLQAFDCLWQQLVPVLLPLVQQRLEARLQTRREAAAAEAERQERAARRAAERAAKKQAQRQEVEFVEAVQQDETDA